ncbi:MAG: 2-oxoglutarate and iron-dependent oxygenase domain-containing protein [Actinomycetota bacterium]
MASTSVRGFEEIPIVDVRPVLGDEPDADFAHQFTDICHHVGFALVTDHGIDPDLVDEMFDMMHRFFALPVETKLLIDKNTSPQMRGWEPVGAETTNNEADVREQIDAWTDWPIADDPTLPIYHRLYGPNQWLPDDVLPGHRELSERWITTLAALADKLMAALSVGLGLPSSHFRHLFGDRPMSLAKFIHYPPTPAGGAGVNPHHDAGFLTVLAPGPTPGLQVQNPHGAWIDVPVIDGTFVINLGEMIQSMSGNYLVATPHRVITREERWSAGYFHGPSLDTELAPLLLHPRFAEAVDASAHHHGAGFMPTPDEASAGTGAMESAHQPSTYGEQLWNYFSRSYAEPMARHHGSSIGS